MSHFIARLNPTVSEVHIVPTEGNDPLEQFTKGWGDSPPPQCLTRDWLLFPEIRPVHGRGAGLWAGLSGVRQMSTVALSGSMDVCFACDPLQLEALLRRP